MSARFYQPVRRIASMMGGWKGRTNEIRHIEQSIQQIMNEREQLSSSLQRHSGDLLECEFRRVINGEADESQMQTLIEHELAPQGQGLVSLVLLGPEGVSRKQMSQLLETVLSRRVRCRCFTTGQLVAGLAVAEDRAAVKAQLQAAFDEMSAVCPGTFCLAVSEIVRSPQAVKASHQQAMEALDMLITTRGSGLFFADELPPSHGRADSSITLYDHMRLQDAIRSGSREEALRIFHWMTEKYFPPEGVPLPWLRLSVVGSMSYETIAATNAESAMGLTFGQVSALTASQYVTIACVMTVSIMVGIWLVPVVGKKLQNGMISLGNRDKKWSDIFSASMFIGMISAFVGYVFCDFSGVFQGDMSGLIPVLVMLVSALAMCLAGLLVKVVKWRWISDYALPISLIAGMASAIPITAWLA